MSRYRSQGAASRRGFLVNGICAAACLPAFQKVTASEKSREKRTIRDAPVLNQQPQLFLAEETIRDAPVLDPQPQLFLADDYFVEHVDRLDLSIGQVQKYHSNPILTADLPWEGKGLSYPCVLFDAEESLYKMWYEVGPIDDSTQGAACYAVSRDGLNWEKPKLGVIRYQNSTANNLVFPPPERGRRHKVFWVVKDYAEVDPQKRYKMLYHLWDFRGRGVGVAHSPDGIHWAAPPFTVLQGTFDTHNVMFWDDRIGQFAGYFRMNDYGVRHISRATSLDGFHWSKPKWVHGPDSEDGPDRDLYTPGVFKYSSAENVYVMITAAWDRYPADRFVAQLGLSRDGVNWQRFRHPFIPHGRPGSWDEGAIVTSPSELLIQGQLAFYYLGSQYAHPVSKPGSRTGAIGLAFMRPDQFVGYRAGERAGLLTTRPMRFGRVLGRHGLTEQYGSLSLNLDLQRGEARVEITDTHGEPYTEYTFAQCRPLTTSGRTETVTWEKRESLSSLLGKQLRFKIQISRGTLYGFRVGFRKDK